MLEGIRSRNKASTRKRDVDEAWRNDSRIYPKTKPALQRGSGGR